LNPKQEPGLKRSISRESLGDLVEPGTLWVHSVPQEVVDTVSETENKRQEAINEVIYTERDFVRDMEYLRDIWIKPLRHPISSPRSAVNISCLKYSGTLTISSVSTRASMKRSTSGEVIHRRRKIGGILLDAVPHFASFVNYGAHQLCGKYKFEMEKNSDPGFAAFEVGSYASCTSS